MKCKYCGHTMNSTGGLSTLGIPPIVTSNYECRYCFAKCHTKYQEAYRADDPPRIDETIWEAPPKSKSAPTSSE